MKRWIGPAILCAVIAVLVLIAMLSQAAPVSTYSTFDTGPNGYQAAFNVLRARGLDVARLQQPFALRNRRIRTLAVTSTEPETSVGEGLVYDPNDYKRLAQFEKRGGRIVYFSSGADDRMQRAFTDHKLHPVILDAPAYTNRALSKAPQHIVGIYDALSGRGEIAFDERLHGYAVDRAMWSVFPWPVRVAVWLVVAAVALVLVDANVRFAPPLPMEPPPDRDSAAYIASMASLLRRARAGRAAIARFTKTSRKNAELEALASLARPDERAVVRAAILATLHRKDIV